MQLSEFFDSVIVRYSEIALKSDRVRRRLVKILKRHIKVQLRRANIDYGRIWSDYGYIYIKTNEMKIEQIKNSLNKTIGVYSFSFAKEINADMTEIIEHLLVLGEIVLKDGLTFGIRAKRFGKHKFSSRDVGIEGGDAILQKFGETHHLQVDLDNPDVWFYVDVRQKAAYLYTDINYTPWGGNPIEYPRGALNSIHGDISSIVSAFMLLKRGIHILPCVFHQSKGNLPEDLFSSVFKKFKEYLPIQKFCFLSFDVASILVSITPEISAETSKKTVEFKQSILEILGVLLRNYVLLWIMQHQSALFNSWKEELENIHYSNLKTSYRGRDLYVEYNAITDGNDYRLTVDTYAEFMLHFTENLLNRSTEYPVFAAAVSFDQSMIEEKFQQIDASLDSKREDLDAYFMASICPVRSFRDFTDLSGEEKNMLVKLIEDLWDKIKINIERGDGLMKLIKLHSI